MIESKFLFFQIKIEAFCRYAIMTIQFVFGITPERFDAVDVVPFSSREFFPMVDSIMFVAIKD